MSLAITVEQEDLRRTVRRFLDDTVPLSKVRELMATPDVFDPSIWRGLVDIGVPGLAVPEEYGGAGLGYQELAYVFEECGRTLATTPLLATVGLAVPLLLASGDQAAMDRWLPGMVAGTSIATVAWLAPGGGWDSAGSALRLANGTLSGSASFVLDGSTAGVLLVVAGTGESATVVAVDADATGVARRSQPTLDQTRPFTRIDFDDVACTPVGPPGAGARLLAAALDVANMLLAAEMTGGAQSCLDMSVGYAKVREQFGRPIGSFQAIKHKCAEMLVEIEGARACAYYAAWAATDNPAELPVVATLAKAAAAEAFFRAAADNVQIHGGIGFTWEHDAHLYFKRAKSALMLFGDVGAYRRQLADRIGL